MPMFTRGCFVLLLMSASACGGINSPTAPTNFAVTLSSPDNNVFFGATAQMTATASDGRALTGGAWSSDNTLVATVGATGLVTPIGAGQAHIIFTASSGQQGNKLLRVLPNLSGTFTGSYTVTSCTQSGQVALGNLCGSYPAGALRGYTFKFTQTVDVVSGRFFLGTIDFGNISGTIGLGGTLTFNAMLAHAHRSGATIDATWNLTAQRPNLLDGTLATIWTDDGRTGQANINGSISTVSKTASISPTTQMPYLELLKMQ